ncbi:MAG: MTH1187 family thiamine-binding protein [bacterium]|nr:MTH1187 family thiamine-binding protein [bacterium]
MLFQVTMFPTSKKGDSASEAVARVINLIDKSGLSYKLTAMATLIEGEWDEVMNLLNRARKMLKRNHDRIYISIVIDDRKKARHRLTGKVESIENRLGREVAK